MIASVALLYATQEKVCKSQAGFIYECETS